MITFVVFILILILSPTSYAHEGKKHNKHKTEHTADSTQMSNRKNEVLSDSIVKTSAHHHDESEESEGPYKLEMVHEIIEHFHNKIVHFTVSLSLVAFLFTLLNFRRKSFDSTIKILVLLAAASALFAVFTGLNQAGVFKGDPKEWVVELHEKLGITSTVLLAIWSVFLFYQPLKRFAWVIGLVVFLFVSAAGFFGGIVAH